MLGACADLIREPKRFEDRPSAAAVDEYKEDTQHDAAMSSQKDEATDSNKGLQIKPPVDRESMSVADIAELAAPSVVAINTEELVQDFYGRVGTQPFAGSGVIISADGYIVTNDHVVGNAQTIQVTLATGESLDAELIGTDPSNDIAVIKIDGKDLPAIEVASSSDTRVGSTVVAIGNPLGVLEGTVTAGVLSATNRNVQSQDGVMYGLLQTDAAINQGNSGGALLNDQGQLIGINSSKAGGMNVEGIAFAIPTDTVMPLVEQLISKGEVQAPQLGIMAFDVTFNMQMSYDLPAGVYVQAVEPGSPADQAGVQAQDVITGIDGQSITRMRELQSLKNRLSTGDTMDLTIYRGGEEIDLTVSFGE